MATSSLPKPDELVAELEKKRPTLNKDLIRKAYLFSARAHDGQMRLSGDPYLSHCIEVARILADLHLDSMTIAGGLLHDIVEDTQMTLDDVQATFGESLASIVDGVTNISEMEFDNPETEQMEQYRKMLLSMAEDVRVILIKLADRLHNMRTLQYLRPEDQRRISKETLDVFAPLAHRLGIAKIKWELEDLALKYLDPEAYEYLANQIDESREERERYIEEFKGPLIAKLKEAGVEASIEGRAKHFYSIYMKMKKQGRPIEDIYDLLAIRVLTSTVDDCYKVLGIIHGEYTPVIERIKDFIAIPKKNGYRSLHTTVLGPRHKRVEIQIRTYEMHRIAEEGIAAHWRYKQGARTDAELDRRLAWLRQTLEWSMDLTDPRDFMHCLKEDLYHNEIFVFTPKGDLKNLPQGATPIDFAYAVHTEVGNHCGGAKVNGKLVSLDTELKNGDTVEIITQASAEPSIDWLKIVRTATARSRIRRYLKAKGFAESVSLGKDLLERQFRKKGKRIPSDRELDELAQSFGRSDTEHLLFAIGSGAISSQQVFNKVYPPDAEPQTLARRRVGVKELPEIKVQGIGNIVVRLAKCCQPVPGDEIVGLVTRGHGISIHRSNCSNVLREDIPEERLMRVDWDTEKDQTFPAEINVICEDRSNLLADVARAISDEGANIASADVHSEGVISAGTFTIEVRNRRHLESVMRAVARVKGVRSVGRKGEVQAA